MDIQGLRFEPRETASALVPMLGLWLPETFPQGPSPAPADARFLVPGDVLRKPAHQDRQKLRINPANRSLSGHAADGIKAKRAGPRH